MSEMTGISSFFKVLAPLPLLWLSACAGPGVGDPCIPEDEYRTQVPGYGVQEVNVESRSFQCETRICLVNHFQGRVSCPYGQTKDRADQCCNMGADDRCAQAAGCTPDTDVAGGPSCRIPGQSGNEGRDMVGVAVAPQLVARRAEDTVYCSCRCGGPDPNSTYCECPSGYACVELVENIVEGGSNLAGRYCVKDGTVYDQSQRVGTECTRDAVDPANSNCGNDGLNP